MGDFVFAESQVNGRVRFFDEGFDFFGRGLGKDFAQHEKSFFSGLGIGNALNDQFSLDDA